MKKLFRFAVIFLLFFPVLVALVAHDALDFVQGLVLYFAFCVFLATQRFEIPIKAGTLLSIFPAILLASSFALTWEESFKLDDIAHGIGISPLTLRQLLTVGVAISAFVFFGVLIQLFSSRSTVPVACTANGSVRGKKWAVIFLSAFIVLTVSTRSSPCYAFNPWNDANAFFTMGKSILAGKVPYRDLYDHKGPLLFFLHALAAAVSFDTFRGVYVLELMAGCLFLLYAYKTLRMMAAEDAPVLLPLLAILVYFSKAMKYGDSVEEFSLPILMFAVYVLTDATVENRMLRSGEAFALGFTAACIFWMKYSLIGFYPGWILPFFFRAIRTKKQAAFWKMSGWIMAGVCVSSAAILSYYLAHHSLRDLFDVYFCDNLLKYATGNSSAEGLLLNLFWGLRSLLRNNPLCLALGILGFWKLSRENRDLKIALLAPWLGMFLTVYYSGRGYDYCALPFSVFAVYGIGFLDHAEMRRILPRKRRLWISVSALSALLLFGIPKIPIMQLGKSDYVQFQVKETVQSLSKGRVELLNYGMLDGGFYTALGIVPDCRVYYVPNMNTGEFTELQDAYIASEDVEFIVCKEPCEKNGYSLVQDYPIDRMTGNQYYLYQKTLKTD